MAREKAGRQANGRSTIYEGNDGYWHGRVTVGVRPDGHPDRRHVMSRHKSVVAEKVRDLEQSRNTGSLLKPGEKWTVEEWLTHWLENIAAPFVKVNTLAGYRVAVNHHLIPGVGNHKLTELRPEHLEKLYQDMLLKRTKGGTLTKPATAHQVHRTVRTALNEAVRRGYLAKNPATLARTQRIDSDEVEPYNVDEIQRLFRTATQTRNGARWAGRPGTRTPARGSPGLEVVGRRLPGLQTLGNPARPVATAVRAWLRGQVRPKVCRLLPPARPDTTGDRHPTKSRAGRRVWSACSDSLSDLSARNAAPSRTRSVLQARGGRSGRTGTGCSPRQSQYPVLRSTPDRLGAAEEAAQGRRHPRRTPSRRTPYRCDSSSPARRQRTDDDGPDGLVQPRHGAALRTHGRPDSPGYRDPSRWPALG